MHKRPEAEPLDYRAPTDSAARPVTREMYRERRLSLLESLTDPSHAHGLEIGAFDLPTVQAQGRCKYADFRSSDEMSTLWGVPRENVADVDYVVTRSRLLPDQISERFDYVVANHVIEHVPDVVSYILELKGVLNPRGLIFLAIPDKRFTSDKGRPSTTIDHTLMHYHDKVRTPSLQQVTEFHRHWIGGDNGPDSVPIQDAYKYASDLIASGQADVHCHVWTDDEFRKSIVTLLQAGFLPGLEFKAFQPTDNGFIEFVVVLMRAD